jgi:hypothetical protein
MGKGEGKMAQKKDYLTGNRGMAYIKKSMTESFGEAVKLIEENQYFKHHGWFQLRYEYLPLRYFILFEGEFNAFHVRILNQDGGFIALNQLTDYGNELLEEDIADAVCKMRERLSSPIAFYKVINDKLYLQTDGIYRRVRKR